MLAQIVDRKQVNYLPVFKRRWSFRQACTLVVAVGILPLVWTLGGGFLGDDFVYVTRFKSFAWSEWPGLFISDWSGGVWGMRLIELRPISALSFMIDGTLWGGSASGYRFTNLAVYLATVILVMRIAQSCFSSHVATLVAGLVFVLQPAQVEAIVWVTGRVDMLATFFALAFWTAADSFVKTGRLRRLFVAALALGGGVYSKETALLCPALLFASWCFLATANTRNLWRRRGALVLAVLAVACVYGICRHVAFGVDATAGRSNWTEPAAWQRQLRYLGWLVPVLPFRDNLEISAAPSVSVGQALFVVTCVCVAVALVWSRVRGYAKFAAVLFFSGGWYLANAGGLLSVGYFSPRHLYFATVGFALAAGGIASAPRLHNRTGIALGVLVLGWFGVTRIVTTIPWQDAGRISNELHDGVAKAAAEMRENDLLIIDVPGMWKTAWLWEWSSPQCAGPELNSRPVAPERVMERPNIYFRSDAWLIERRPVEALMLNGGAIALTVDPTGYVQVLRVDAARIADLRRKLALAIQRDNPSQEWGRLIHQAVTEPNAADPR